jgi:lactam utilization protein B
METHLLRLIAAGRVATLCIHGDDARAVDNARLVRRILGGQGIAVRSFA